MRSKRGRDEIARVILIAALAVAFAGQSALADLPDPADLPAGAPPPGPSSLPGSGTPQSDTQPTGTGLFSWLPSLGSTLTSLATWFSSTQGSPMPSPGAPDAPMTASMSGIHTTPNASAASVGLFGDPSAGLGGSTAAISVPTSAPSTAPSTLSQLYQGAQTIGTALAKWAAPVTTAVAQALFTPTQRDPVTAKDDATLLKTTAQPAPRSWAGWAYDTFVKPSVAPPDPAVPLKSQVEAPDRGILGRLSDLATSTYRPTVTKDLPGIGKTEIQPPARTWGGFFKSLTTGDPGLAEPQDGYAKRWDFYGSSTGIEAALRKQFGPPSRIAHGNPAFRSWDLKDKDGKEIRYSVFNDGTVYVSKDGSFLTEYNPTTGKWSPEIKDGKPVPSKPIAGGDKTPDPSKQIAGTGPGAPGATPGTGPGTTPGTGPGTAPGQVLPGHGQPGHKPCPQCGPIAGIGQQGHIGTPGVGGLPGVGAPGIGGGIPGIGSGQPGSGQPGSGGRGGAPGDGSKIGGTPGSGSGAPGAAGEAPGFKFASGGKDCRATTIGRAPDGDRMGCAAATAAECVPGDQKSESDQGKSDKGKSRAVAQIEVGGRSMKAGVHLGAGNLAIIEFDCTGKESEFPVTEVCSESEQAEYDKGKHQPGDSIGAGILFGGKLCGVQGTSGSSVMRKVREVAQGLKQQAKAQSVASKSRPAADPTTPGIADLAKLTAAAVGTSAPAPGSGHTQPASYTPAPAD